MKHWRPPFMRFCTKPWEHACAGDWRYLKWSKWPKGTDQPFSGCLLGIWWTKSHQRRGCINPCTGPD